MKIQNEYIKIKANREFILKNYLYDNYLKAFSLSQYCDEYDESYEQAILMNYNYQKYLNLCYVKFDTALTDYRSATKSDFDIIIECSKHELTGNQSGVSMMYIYDLVNGATTVSGTAITDLTPYYNRKITALGFSNKYAPIGMSTEILACVDTSNYSMYLVADETFKVARKDIFTTNAICTGAEYPLHLAPSIDFHQARGVGVKEMLGRLYSIGTGTQLGVMQNEKIIGTDVDIIVHNNYSFGLNYKVGVDPARYPSTTLQPSSSKYPVASNYLKEIQPLRSIYPSSSKYPMKANTKYSMYKYAEYGMSGAGAIVYTGNYYIMNYFNETKGLFEVKNTIQRG